MAILLGQIWPVGFILFTVLTAKNFCAATSATTIDKTDKFVHLFVVRRNLDIPG